MKAAPVASPLVRSLFDAPVVAIEMRVPGDPEQLLPQERAGQDRWVEKRVREYASGRQCARLALGELGVRDYALLNAADRCPVWPEGIAGSITHTEGFTAAVAARASEVAGVGVDVERIGRVTEDLWERLFVPAEIAWIAGQGIGLRPAAAALLFGAKEALYKCQYPLTRRWLDFHDVMLEVEGLELAEREPGRVRVAAGARVLDNWPDAARMRGRFAVHEGRVVSSFELATLRRTS